MAPTTHNDSTAAAQAATITGTNRTYVSGAKSLLQNAPDLAEQVKAGEIKITEARRQLAQRQSRKRHHCRRTNIGYGMPILPGHTAMPASSVKQTTTGTRNAIIRR